MACEPLVATAPFQPPEAVQAVALVADQVRVELPPEDTLAGSALSETVGGRDCDGGGLEPCRRRRYSSVKFVVALSAGVPCDPLWLGAAPTVGSATGRGIGGRPSQHRSCAALHRGGIRSESHSGGRRGHRHGRGLRGAAAGAGTSKGVGLVCAERAG